MTAPFARQFLHRVETTAPAVVRAFETPRAEFQFGRTGAPNVAPLALDFERLKIRRGGIEQTSASCLDQAFRADPHERIALASVISLTRGPLGQHAQHSLEHGR